MHYDFSLIEDNKSALYLFDHRVEPLLFTYLRDECILDSEGINRVMPVLKRSFVYGAQLLQLVAKVADEVIPPPDQNGLTTPEYDAVNIKINELGKKVSDVITENQMSMMFGMAKSLAYQDERVYKRPRH